MQHNHGLVHHRKQRQLLKDLHEQTEDNVAVFLAALQLKAIHSADREVLVVATVQDHVVCNRRNKGLEGKDEKVVKTQRVNKQEPSAN